MDSKNNNREFKLSTDKSLLVSAFLAIVLFVVLYSIVTIVNRNGDYTKTTSSAIETDNIKETETDLIRMEEELNVLEQQIDSDSESFEEPTLEINLELEE